ncbi:MAG: hypothetical protein E6H58_13245, partial [Betaproteobacteria bacterium]
MSAVPKIDAPLACPTLSWRNRFAALGERFYTTMPADPVPNPRWVAVSDSCARELGFPHDWWQREDWHALEVFSGNAQWPGMQPLASVYSGHQ